LGTAAFRISVPTVAYYSRTVLKGTMVEIGLLTVFFFLGRSISSVLAGRSCDRLLRVGPLAAVCFLLHSLVVLLYSFAASWLEVLTLRGIQGALNGVAWTLVQYSLGASVGREIRGRAYSLYFISGTIGFLIGNLVYASMACLSVTEILLPSSILMAAAGMSSYRLEGGPVKSVSERAKSSSESSDLVVAFLSSMVFASAAYSSLLSGDLMYIYTNEFLGMSRSTSALVIGLANALGMVGSLSLTWVADSRGDVLSLKLSLLLTAVGSAIFSMKWALAVAGYFLVALGMKSMMPLSRRIVMTYSRKRGLALGVVNAVGNIGTASSSLAFGALLEMTGEIGADLPFVVPVLVISSVLLAVMFLSLIYLSRRIQ